MKNFKKIISNTYADYRTKKNKKSAIISWLEDKKIKNYRLQPDINEGFVVNVIGSVDLHAQELKSIDVKFNHVEGYFNCGNNVLMSLHNGPQIVGGDFCCSYNQLENLTHGPHFVGGDFFCDNNKIEQFEHAPRKIWKSFFCDHNLLTNLKKGPNFVGRDYCCHNNMIESIEYCPEHVGGHFFGDQNLGPSILGETTDFKHIYEAYQKIVNIKKEKNELSQMIVSSQNSKKISKI